jgi:hypothetical protein
VGINKLTDILWLARQVHPKINILLKHNVNNHLSYLYYSFLQTYSKTEAIAYSFQYLPWQIACFFVFYEFKRIQMNSKYN